MKPRKSSLLVALTLFYSAASLLHFTHNAEYLGDYPNLPGWLTRPGVYLAWTGLTAFGIAGFAIYLIGRQLIGLVLLGIYAAFGFDGLLHYTRAPIDAHTSVMNFMIWFEVAAASALLFAVVTAVVKRIHRYVLDA